MLVLALTVTSCRQADVRTAAIFVPGMKNEACANLIVNQLAVSQGIHPTQIVVRLEAKTMEVRYDTLRQSLKNLEYAVADAGFDANDIPANEKVRNNLPEACR